MAGADDYMHEAALADDPPSGAFYDPDHATNVQRLPSLGVHEHWNNPVQMQYSRNLGAGDGIELVGSHFLTAVHLGRSALGLQLTSFPNPFNPSTTMRFDLPTAARVRATVYSGDGRLVRALMEGDLPAGRHEAVWDGRDSRGNLAASGIYSCRIVAGERMETIKLALLR
jgi:hypothetical protein